MVAATAIAVEKAAVLEMVIDILPGEELGLSISKGSGSNAAEIKAVHPGGAVMRLYGDAVNAGDVIVTINGEDARGMTIDDVLACVRAGLSAPRPLRLGVSP